MFTPFAFNQSFSFSSLDTSVQNWYNLSVAAGSLGASENTLTALSTHVAEIKLAGLWSTITRYNLYLGPDVGSYGQPLISTANSTYLITAREQFTGNWSGSGFYSEPSGLKAPTTTSFITLGAVFPSLLTIASSIIIFDCLSDISNSSIENFMGGGFGRYVGMGYYQNTDGFAYPGNPTFLRGGSGRVAIWTFATLNTGPSSCTLYRNSTVVAQSTTTGDYPTANNVSLFGAQGGGSPVYPSPQRFGCYLFATYWSSSQLATFQTSYNKFKTAIGRS